MERRLYEREREDRKIYRSKDLQMSILQLIFSLMLAPKYVRLACTVSLSATCMFVCAELIELFPPAIRWSRCTTISSR
jgi:hypothetical protein